MLFGNFGADRGCFVVDDGFGRRQGGPLVDVDLRLEAALDGIRRRACALGVALSVDGEASLVLDEGRDRLTDHSLFEIGSVTKTMTGLVLATAVVDSGVSRPTGERSWPGPAASPAPSPTSPATSPPCTTRPTSGSPRRPCSPRRSTRTDRRRRPDWPGCTRTGFGAMGGDRWLRLLRGVPPTHSGRRRAGHEQRRSGRGKRHPAAPRFVSGRRKMGARCGVRPRASVDHDIHPATSKTTWVPAAVNRLTLPPAPTLTTTRLGRVSPGA